MDKLGYSVNEVAEKMGVSAQFLRYEIKLGHLPVRHYGRRVLVLAGDLATYLETGSEGTKAPASVEDLLYQMSEAIEQIRVQYPDVSLDKLQKRLDQLTVKLKGSVIY